MGCCVRHKWKQNTMITQLLESPSSHMFLMFNWEEKNGFMRFANCHSVFIYGLNSASTFFWIGVIYVLHIMKGQQETDITRYNKSGKGKGYTLSK